MEIQIEEETQERLNTARENIAPLLPWQHHLRV
jgi:hypothetical protein